MQLTRMPSRPWSPAMDCVSPTTAALEVVYGVLLLARRPAMEERVMMEPPPPFFISGHGVFRGEDDALDVDRHDVVPLLLGDVGHVGAGGDADVVVEDVEPTVALDRGAHHRLAVGGAGDVGGHGGRGPAFGLDEPAASPRRVRVRGQRGAPSRLRARRGWRRPCRCRRRGRSTPRPSRSPPCLRACLPRYSSSTDRHRRRRGR